jgi:AcrR family transcriptional regulator
MTSESLPIWVRPEPGTRRARFSREQIAAAAVAIADAEGFEAVSMRRTATDLGAGTMSRYRYISAKGDLVALMDDALMGESLVPGELPADWREALALIARQTRAALLAHPWAVMSLQGRSAAAQDGSFGPNGLRHFEQSLAALDSAPLDAGAKLDLLAIVDDYVFGSVLRAGELEARTRTDAARTAAITEFIGAQLSTGAFPRIAALSQDPTSADVASPDRVTARFEAGLAALIGAGGPGAEGAGAAPAGAPVAAPAGVDR